LAGVSFGQTPYITNDYIYAPDDKHAPQAISTIDGREIEGSSDRVTFYEENFDGGFGGWISEIQTGPVGFKLTDTGHENDPMNTFQIPVIATSTPTQWVLIDSDGDGINYDTDEAATLVSPMIDLSSSIGSFVALNFDQFYAEWQPVESDDHCYVGVSTDAGVTWSEIEINEGVGREARPNPERISWDISDIIAGFESTVWLRFRWDGAWNYGWQIDNVSVEDINGSDVSIVDTYRAIDAGIVYSQIAEAQARPIALGAIIKNIGHFDQTNVGFNYTITSPGGTEVASGTVDASIPTLTNGQQDTVFAITGYTPDELGNYTIEWTAIADDTDEDLANNEVTDAHFELTEFTTALDYDEGPVIEIDNWPLKVGEAYFGNIATFPNPDVATAMLIKLTDYNDNIGEVVKAGIWEFPEGGTEWFLAYDSDDYEITSDDLDNWITIDLETFDLNPTSTYLFCGYQYGSAVQPLFERQGDIGLNNNQGRDDEFLDRTFFDRRAPLVRIRLNEGEVGVEELEDEAAEFFALYPNPATSEINVGLALNNSAQTALNIVDISGKVITTRNLGEVNGTIQTSLPLDELTPGVYFIELVNADGKQVKKFVKR